MGTTLSTNMPGPANESGKTVKRRGILAAAGAAVAAIVAKQTAQPVAALDPNDLALGTGNSTSDATTLTYTGAPLDAKTILSVTDGTILSPPWPSAVAGYANGSRAHIGVYGYTGGIAATSAGVYGSSIGYAPGVYGGNSYPESNYGNVGVHGQSNGSHGVYGETFAPAYSGQAGVRGAGNGDGTFGVYGLSYGTGVGVQGWTDNGIGVQGTTGGSGFPIVGLVPTNTGANVVSPGVLGIGTKGPGVQGQSTSGHGLVGTTNATDGHAGLMGNANNAGGVGLMGIGPGYGTGSAGKAGIFYGNVQITGGTLSAPVMQAAVQHQGDNSYRLLHTMVSPDGWAEDFGDGTLTNGAATVSLDPDFAALVETVGYHVYLTEYGDHHNLFVATRSASGFTVQAKETANPVGVKAPTKGVTGAFSYRVVAKRKDIKAVRLAKVTPPTPPKSPAAFTIPETPGAKPPAKNP
jgi:hypothetical protein